MGTTFKAICPQTKDLQVFEIVSENGRTKGWCSRCRQTWPLAELSDGQGDPKGKKANAPPAPPKRRKRR